MIMLIYFSIVSWSIIIQRTFVLHSAIRKTKSFAKKFCSGIDLHRLYQESLSNRENLTGSEKIFYTGFKEYTRLNHVNSNDPEAIVEVASRVMHISMNRELDNLEKNIPLLGTIGSISPYIGLCGTVWSIMHVFIGLGTKQQVTLQMIAPGVAEALIATAIGLLTSIPAVIAFNRLNICVNKLEQSYDNFTEELITVLNRQVFVRNSK